jgi:C-terminal binding protein
MLALRKAIVLYHDTQRADPPAPWRYIETPLTRRSGVQGFGIIGLGRIGTAAALRAKAFGFRVMFYDPYRPNGTERAIGIERAASLEALLPHADVLSIHAPQTPETCGMLGEAQLSLLPRGAVVINTARGPILDPDALMALMQSGHIAGAGLDVLPVEPPENPPALLRAYRERAPWQLGRLIITPHAAFINPEAALDIRIKSAETMRAALLSNRPQNVITPDMF